jgi:hypothetical protein
MSRKSRDRNRVRRLAVKKARKERNKALYIERIAAGRNTLTKRAKIAARKGKSKKVRAVRHLGPCNNSVGCPRCGDPRLTDPWLATPGSCLYGKRWSSTKHREAA